MSTPTKAPGGTLDRVFHLSANHTDVKTEVMAGVTTFMTMAYILAVNPSILSAAGMDAGAVFTATCLASILATVLMAVFANYPFVLSAGMGLNAYFAYTVVIKMGYSWQMALAAVFVEGVIFILLSLTNVREAIFNAIPLPLKHAVSAGIGLFIAFIGLQNCKLVVESATLVGVYNFADNAADFRTVGITVLLAIIGVLITSILVVKKVKGNILWGILATWVLGILCQVTGLYDPSVLGSVLPDFSNGIAIPSVLPTLGQLDFSKVLSLDFLVVVFAFLFVDMFDTLGTLIGVASKADMLDQDGKLPKIRGALMADAVGTTAGAVLGTSTITTFVESASGVSEGGRTGLTSLVSAALFGAALFLSPIFLAIPSFATAPALIVVGFLMVGAILKVDFDNAFDAIPAYITLIAMPFMYSISEGIAMGTISYVVINLFGGKERRNTISVVMYILAILFVFKYILI
ncbi:NCS2 family permease [Pseudoflavonifractor phocaeensis]|uniref:NCS2 family permease n=1 Tax=Pseudoflavonifractor phocaeensis TaxID=1870988 RepID=UPI00313CF7BF